MKCYKINLFCKNCGKRFKEKIPIGIEAREANLPNGIYLHNKEGYFDISGKLISHAKYLFCPRCHTQRIRKEIDC